MKDIVTVYTGRYGVMLAVDGLGFNTVSESYEGAIPLRVPKSMVHGGVVEDVNGVYPSKDFSDLICKLNPQYIPCEEERMVHTTEEGLHHAKSGRSFHALKFPDKTQGVVYAVEVPESMIRVQSRGKTEWLDVMVPEGNCNLNVMNNWK